MGGCSFGFLQVPKSSRSFLLIPPDPSTTPQPRQACSRPPWLCAVLPSRGLQLPHWPLGICVPWQFFSGAQGPSSPPSLGAGPHCSQHGPLRAVCPSRLLSFAWFLALCRCCAPAWTALCSLPPRTPALIGSSAVTPVTCPQTTRVTLPWLSSHGVMMRFEGLVSLLSCGVHAALDSTGLPTRCPWKHAQLLCGTGEWVLSARVLVRGVPCSLE